MHKVEHTRSIWLRAHLDAAYAPKLEEVSKHFNRSGEPSYPSSFSRKFVAEPESLDMKTIVPMGIFVCKSFWAVMIGPMVFVCR